MLQNYHYLRIARDTGGILKDVSKMELQSKEAGKLNLFLYIKTNQGFNNL